MTELNTSITITQIRTHNKYEILSIGVNLNHSAIINLKLFNDNNNDSDSVRIEMTGTDYENWGTDDSYIDTFIQTKLAEMFN